MRGLASESLARTLGQAARGHHRRHRARRLLRRRPDRRALRRGSLRRSPRRGGCGGRAAAQVRQRVFDFLGHQGLHQRLDPQGDRGRPFRADHQSPRRAARIHRCAARGCDLLSPADPHRGNARGVDAEGRHVSRPARRAIQSVDRERPRRSAARHALRLLAAGRGTADVRRLDVRVLEQRVVALDGA